MEDVDLKKIQEAAMKPSLDKVSELIVLYAKNKIDVENARIRFVDHTGNRLVPEEIVGFCYDDKRMAIRFFNECIIGRVAQNRRSELVKDIQSDADFKLFLNKIDEYGRKEAYLNIPREKWKEYSKSLRTLKSEIAIPITIANTPDSTKRNSDYVSQKPELIGIINVNSVGTVLTRKDMDILDNFGSALALTFLNRRSFLFKQLHKIEEDMMSASSWDDVVEKIFEGLNYFVKDSIPNIYLFKENGDNNPFSFLFPNKATDEHKELGKFLPRWGDPNKKGLGELSIENWQKDGDGFVVIEDVQNDIPPNGDRRIINQVRATDRAKAKGVKTICCLPLVFHGEIVGVLYLHFKKAIHYFTEDEKIILKMFAFSAAITIKNAASTPSYKDLCGNNLINYILNYQGDQNDRVLIQLKDLTRKLQNSKGNNEIVHLINKGILEIGKTLDMPKQIFKINSSFQKYEELILYDMPNYRDHFLHMFFVFSTGFLLINEWNKKNVPIFNVKNMTDYNNLIKAWYICSIMHDVAYPVSHVKRWIPQFPKKTLDLPSEINATFDWTPLILIRSTHESVEAISSRFVENIIDPMRKEKKKSAFRLWFHHQLLSINDHGAIGALTILNIPWEKSYLNIALDAALAVTLHNYVKTDKFAFQQIEIKSYPLAFLLTYCDVIQEWGRQVGDVDEDPKITRVFKKLYFNNLVVGSTEKPDSTSIFLIYTPEKNVTAEMDEDEIRSIISDQVSKNVSPYISKWNEIGLSHVFHLQIDHLENDPDPYLISIP